MARLAERFGFKIVNQIRKKNAEYYYVAGKTDEIRKNFEEFVSQKDRNGRTIVENLERRVKNTH